MTAEDAAMDLRSTPRRRAARPGVFVLFAALLCACGGGGSDTNTAPTISALSFSPSAVYVGSAGSTVDVGGHVDFADAEGNVDTLTLTILDAGGATLSSTTYDIALTGKPKSGVINGVFTVSSATVGLFTFRLVITDTGGLSSNALQGQFRVSAFPWVARAPMPAKRRDFATATLGGLVYVIGGGDTLAGTTPAPATRTVQVYDPVLDAWSAAPDLPVAMAGLSGADLAAVAVANRIIVFGVSTSSGLVHSAVQRFDPSTSTWTAGADAPRTHMNAAVAALGGSAYLIGGSEGFDLSAVDAYDPVADSWTAAPSLAVARRDLGAIALGGRALALGGYSSGYVFDGGYRRTVESYDPIANAWSSAPDMLVPRSNFAVAVSGGRCFVIGGGNVMRALADVEAFDPTSGAWSVKTAMPIALPWPRAEVVGGRIYVFDTDVTLEYTPANDIL